MMRLDPRNDPSLLAELYAAQGRLQVRNFLLEEDAEGTWRNLVEHTPWGVVFNRGDRVIQMAGAAVARLSPQQNQQLLREIHERARSGYQFLYNAYPLLAAYTDPDVPRLPIFEAMEFVNSKSFLDFARALTRIDGIRWADCHATLFRAGHFLKYHTDETPTEKRLAAYVLNFTKGWGRDWGGFLQFFNGRYDVEEAYRPVFNALNIFTVPADHSVGMIADYAPAGRYSLTGWLRGDEPPPRIPREA